jgi:hypothetical protein
MLHLEEYTMFRPFFGLAAVSPTRQTAFRSAVLLHLAIVAGGAWLVTGPHPRAAAPWLGHLLLIAGIVEGAALVGWRLTQLPKSQALEFLLVSPLRPHWVFVAEALVGVARLALVTLSGLPVLALLAVVGCFDHLDLLLLLVMPFTWGAVAGLTLTVWAYESLGVRRWAERGMLLLILTYLAVGVLAGEHLQEWLAWLPGPGRRTVLNLALGFHTYNPFALLGAWLGGDPWVPADWTVGLEVAALAALVLLGARGAWRMQGHFQDRHYRPVVDRSGRRRPAVGNRPLSWWAVRRVSEYSGRINIWLAGGFGLLYALYTVAGPHWPAWLGRQVFEMADAAGGIPALAAALVVLAAVPAAFQYGLWDSSAQDRCRRLELLLLTHLDGRDYFEAAGAAAWRRGRAYFGIAVLLWLAAVLAGQVATVQAVAALAASVLLWGLYFALGFRAFARGIQANRLGTLLTLGLPLAAVALYRAGWPTLAALLPPGGVYAAGSRPPALVLLAGPFLAAGLALVVARRTLADCDRELRRWYERHHGHKMLD